MSATAETAEKAPKKLDLFVAMAGVDLASASDEEYRPVGDGEKVLGVMSENTRRLDHVRLELRRKYLSYRGELLKMISRHEEERDEDLHSFDLEALLSEFMRRRSKLLSMLKEYELVDSVFFSLLRLELGFLDGTKELRIRKGWQVVAEDCRGAVMEVLLTRI